MDSNELDEKVCTICYLDFPKSSMVSLECGHEFCQTCVKSHVKNFMDHNLSTMIPKCPNYYCKKQLKEEELFSFSSKSDKERYLNFQRNVKVVTDGHMRFCPTPNCEHVIPIPVGCLSSKLRCDKCAKDFCKDCGFPWHEGLNCSELLKKEFGEWSLSKYVNKCPKCRTIVEKAAGCQHMTCGLCRYEWCWVCGMPYNSFVHYKEIGYTFCEMIG